MVLISTQILKMNHAAERNTERDILNEQIMATSRLSSFSNSFRKAGFPLKN